MVRDSTPEYSLTQLKPSLAGVQRNSGFIPHVASSSTLRTAGGALLSKTSQGDLASLNESAHDLRSASLPSRLPTFDNNNAQDSSSYFREQFWRNIRDDALYLEDSALDDGSQYVGLTISAVDRDVGQLIFEYEFAADPPSTGNPADWILLPSESNASKMKKLVVSVSFPEGHLSPNRDVQPTINAVIQNVSLFTLFYFIIVLFMYVYIYPSLVCHGERAYI